MTGTSINTLDHTPLGKVMDTFEQRVVPGLMDMAPSSNTVTVFRGNERIWCKSFGWADRDNQVPATSDSIYRIASVTKPFTATAMLLLAEQGVLALDDPVELYLPEIRALISYGDHPPITLRQLASHTSGLAQEADLPDNASGPIEEWEQKTLDCIPTTRFEGRPGAQYVYSNIAFCYLGLALGRAANTPYRQLIHERILDPLGMSQSGFVLTSSMRASLAEGYVLREDGSIDAETPVREHAGRGCKVPAGGLYTTSEDLTHFLAVHTGSSPIPLLSKESRMEMQRVHTPAHDELYGLGSHIEIEPDGTHLLVCGGNIAGYATRIVYDPVTTLGVVLMRNFNCRPGEELTLLCRQLLLDLITVHRDT